jgi:predicted permease
MGSNQQIILVINPVRNDWTSCYNQLIQNMKLSSHEVILVRSGTENDDWNTFCSVLDQILRNKPHIDMGFNFSIFVFFEKEPAQPKSYSNLLKGMKIIHRNDPL